MSKRKFGQYTQKEIDTLIDCIQKSPSNIGAAFKNASKLTGRTANALKNLWYSKVKHGKTIFTLESNKDKSSNTKNIAVKPEVNHYLNIQLELNDLKTMMSKLSNAQKLELSRHLLNTMSV